MSSFQDRLRDYAELIAVHGLNVQPDQLVQLSGEPPHRPLLLLLSEICYDLGARYVEVELYDQRFSRIRIERSPESSLSSVPSFLSRKYDEFVEQQAASLKLLGPEYPEAMVGADPKRTNTVRKALYEARKRFYEEGIDKGRVQWTVAAAATAGWGKRLYPELTPEDAEAALWEDLFRFCRVGNGDHLARWQDHDRELRERAAYLSQIGIERLHFVSQGTDLWIGLSPHAVFQGGRSMSTREVLFEPNLPTEECFTTPDWRSCRGRVTATRPFYVNGELIEGLVMELQDGEITEFSAKAGEAVFREYISSDEGARRVGEVALVSVDSPIYQAGRVYEEILLDENAACHIAIGSAYRFCVALPSDPSDEDWKDVGCNSSSVHTDIMISDESTTVTAFTRSGASIPLIERGRWTDHATHDRSRS